MFNTTGIFTGPSYESTVPSGVRRGRETSTSSPVYERDGYYGSSGSNTKESGGFFKTLLKGATAIAVPILGFFGLKKFKPEWAQIISEPINRFKNQFVPDGVLNLFTKGKESITKLFTGDGALAKIFKPVQDFFGKFFPASKTTVETGTQAVL